MSTGGANTGLANTGAMTAVAVGFVVLLILFFAVNSTAAAAAATTGNNGINNGGLTTSITAAAAVMSGDTLYSDLATAQSNAVTVSITNLDPTATSLVASVANPTGGIFASQTLTVDTFGIGTFQLATVDGINTWLPNTAYAVSVSFYAKATLLSTVTANVTLPACFAVAVTAGASAGKALVTWTNGPTNTAAYAAGGALVLSGAGYTGAPITLTSITTPTGSYTVSGLVSGGLLTAEVQFTDAVGNQTVIAVASGVAA